jgi:hypothetical protein
MTKPIATDSPEANKDQITVSGELVIVAGGEKVVLSPASDGEAFDIEISAIGTTYRVDLVDAAQQDARQWQLVMTRAPTFGNQNWGVALSAPGAVPIACGGITMTTEPAFVTCSAAVAELAADRTELSLAFGGTRLVESFGTAQARLDGTLEVAFPAPLRIARLEDYPSRSSATITLDGALNGVSSIISPAPSDNGPSKLEAMLEAPALANGVTVDADTINLTLANQTTPGETVNYTCGRQLTDAEYACLEAPMTMAGSCDTSFLIEARLCKSISYQDDGAGGVEASFDETLFDDITSRTVRSVRASARLASGPPVRGKISSSDGRFEFSCDRTCNVLRSITASPDDIREMIIIGDGGEHALGIERSLLYPDRVTVTLDMAFGASTLPENGYEPMQSQAIRFKDETSEISLESLRLKQFAGSDSIVLSGRVQAFAH